MKITFENIIIKEGYIRADYEDDENSCVSQVEST